MQPYERHVFICQNRRDPSSPKGCCADKGAGDLLDRLKKLTYNAGLKGKVRINKAGCLGRCGAGAAIVVYPEAVWYARVKLEDIEEIFSEHILHGRPVERLRG